MSRPKRRKTVKRLTSLTVGDATRRPHYIHGPGVKKDDLLQRLGKCEDTIERITDAVRRCNDDRSAPRYIAMIRSSLHDLDAQIQKERSENG
jgi:hypothetical protein